jgi:hypothetical protein
MPENTINLPVFSMGYLIFQQILYTSFAVQDFMVFMPWATILMMHAWLQVLDFAAFSEPEYDLPIFCANAFTTPAQSIVVL